MHPHVIFLTNGRNSHIVFITAINGGACHSIHIERSTSFTNALLDHLFQFFRNQGPIMREGRHSKTIVRTKTTDLGCSRNRVMRLSRSKADWLIIYLPTFVPDMREVLLSSTHHRSQVTNTSSRQNHSIHFFLLKSQFFSKQSHQFHL